MTDRRPKLRDLPPSEAWEDAARRSLAAGVAGWFPVGVLLGIVFSGIFRSIVILASTPLASFLATLAFAVFYYHRRSWLGIRIAAIASLFPFVVDFLWVKATPWSLWYPIALTFLAGLSALWVFHQKASGSRWEDDPEDLAVEAAMAEFEAEGVTWFDQFLVLWILGVVVLLVLRFLR